MKLTVNNYPDFVSVVNRLGATDGVFYFIPSEGVAYISALVEDGRNAVEVVISSSGPNAGAILADFPTAVALASTLSIST